MVLDSEGMFSIDSNKNHDIKIFLLCILISSMVLYNSKGAIDENELQSLSLICQLSKEFKINNYDNENDFSINDIKDIFPSFIWILRDHALLLKDVNNNDINSKEYLENALKEIKGFNDNINHKNRIRKLIKLYFNDRDCQCLA